MATSLPTTSHTNLWMAGQLHTLTIVVVADGVGGIIVGADRVGGIIVGADRVGGIIVVADRVGGHYSGG